METKEKNYKLVLQNKNNSDQDLFGFYGTESEAVNAKPFISDKYRLPINNLLVKPVDVSKINNPVSTDYSHYCVSLIPEFEFRNVMQSDAAAEISCNYMFCGGCTYYNLSQIIPRHYTVIDMGCGYNAQSYFFQNHRRHIAVNDELMLYAHNFKQFQAPRTELLKMKGQDFITDKLPKLKLDLKKTFVIINFVPDEELRTMVKETFLNIFCYYPSSK